MERVIGFGSETVDAFRQPAKVVADLIIAPNRYADRKIGQIKPSFLRLADRSPFLFRHDLMPLVPISELVKRHSHQL
jgi:hypothetical protein